MFVSICFNLCIFMGHLSHLISFVSICFRAKKNKYYWHFIWLLGCALNSFGVTLCAFTWESYQFEHTSVSLIILSNYTIYFQVCCRFHYWKMSFFGRIYDRLFHYFWRIFWRKPPCQKNGSKLKFWTTRQNCDEIILTN